MTIASVNFTEKDRIRRALVWMILAGLAVRFLLALISYRYLVDPSEDYFPYGWEVGRVARSLALGHGFSSPYQGDTGPTAVLPPLYPYFVGGVFKLFGIYSTASALVILAIQSITSALTCIPIFFIARRTFNLRVARIAGWTWTFFPYAIFISAATIWSTSLSALLLALAFWLTLQLEEGAGWSAWLWLGLLGGVIGWTNPTILTLYPFFVVWVWLHLRRRGAGCIPQAAVAAAIAFLCIAPWFVRNYRVFGKMIPVRSNIGLHMYVGNTLDTSTYWHPELDPPHSPVEMQEMVRMGEIAYMARKREQVFAFIHQHPGIYIWLVTKRIVYFWTGIWNLSPEFLKADIGLAMNIPICTAISVLTFVGLRRAFHLDRSTAWLYALGLLIYPLLYYMTTTELPYRHPLDPLIVILGVVGVVGTRE